MTIFAKNSILGICQGSEYASGLLKLTSHSSTIVDTQEGWYMPNWLKYSLLAKNFPLFWSHSWTYNIQANKKLTKVKESFHSFFHSLCYIVLDNKCHKHKWHALVFTHIKLVVCVLLCMHVITCIKWRNLGVIVKWGKNRTNLTNLSISCYLLWPSLPHFLVLIHWSLAFMNK